MWRSDKSMELNSCRAFIIPVDGRTKISPWPLLFTNLPLILTCVTLPQWHYIHCNIRWLHDCPMVSLWQNFTQQNSPKPLNDTALCPTVQISTVCFLIALDLWESAQIACPSPAHRVRGKWLHWECFYSAPYWCILRASSSMIGQGGPRYILGDFTLHKWMGDLSYITLKSSRVQHPFLWRDNILFHATRRSGSTN